MLYTDAGAHDGPVPKKNIHITLQSLPQLPADSTSCVIPFSRAGNLILLKASADTTAGNFILDTGAPGLVLNLTYFRDYAAVADHGEEQSGITGGGAAVVRTEVKSLQFGCITTSNTEANLLSLGHIENLKGVKILGLLGVSLFRQFEMIIDYENNLLYLHRFGKKDRLTYLSPHLKNGTLFTTVPFDMWNNKIVTSTILNGKKIRLIIDSGAESNLLDSRLPQSVFDNVEILKRIKLNGTGDKKVEALYGNLSNLFIGGQNTGILTVIITNLEKTCLADNSCIDGILGFDFLSLHKIGFNFVTNKMYIWK